MASKALLTKVGSQQDLPVGVYRRIGRRGSVIGYNVSITKDGVADLIYVSVQYWGEEGALAEALRLRAVSEKDNVSPKNISAELVERFKPLREAGLVCRGKYSGGYLLLAHAKDKTPITVLWKPDKKSLKETVDRCKSKGAVLKPFDYDLFESKLVEMAKENGGLKRCLKEW